MHRFFINKENIINDTVLIDGDDVKHIKNVLRLKIGSKIVVCDGECSDYVVEIAKIGNNDVCGTILNKEKSKGEPPIDIVLYQGLPKSAKMDLIVQKCTELGVCKIVPIVTERTVVKVEDNKKEQKKIDRWNRIALEAAKQSKRGKVPEVKSIISFERLINDIADGSFTIVPYEDELKIGAKEILKKCNGEKINIIIGPEGGFEETEIAKLKEIGGHIISLGPRILRTETAGFATLSIIMYELGDLGVI